MAVTGAQGYTAFLQANLQHKSKEEVEEVCNAIIKLIRRASKQAEQMKQAKDKVALPSCLTICRRKCPTAA